MYILQKSAGGVQAVPMIAKFMEKRRVMLYWDYINTQVAFEVCRQILLLDAENHEPITLIINSLGGDVNAGLLIYDAIQGCHSPVRTVCTGRAYSMAAIIFAGGEKGERYILPHSEVMIHGPRVGDFGGCDVSAAETVSNKLRTTKGTLAEILAECTGKPLAEIDNAISYDHYFTDVQAVEFGLCDGICSFGEIMDD